MKKTLTSFGFFLSTTLACAYFVSCNFRKDYTNEIRKIDSLAVLVDSSLAALKSVTYASYNADSALKNLLYIQENYNGTMPRLMAKALDQYGMMRKDMVSVGEFSQTLSYQLDTAKKQALDLRQALSEGATHDSKDNKITEDYVKGAIIAEEGHLSDLLNSAKKCVDKSTSMQALYHQMTPQVRMWTDSIPQKMEK